MIKKDILIVELWEKAEMVIRHINFKHAVKFYVEFYSMFLYNMYVG